MMAAAAGNIKYKIIYRKKEFGLANFMLKMMVEYSDKDF